MSTFRGSKTFQMAKDTLPKNSTKIVLTKEHKVSKHSDVMYLSGPVHSILAQLAALYDSALLLGGAYTYRQFFYENAVDKAFVTLEPKKLNEGIPLFDTPGNPIKKIITHIGKETGVKKLNDTGTLLYEFNR